jgi:hypothetical protein
VSGVAPAVRRRASPYRLTAERVSEIDLQVTVAGLLDLVLLPPTIWFPLPIGHIKLTAVQQARLSRIRVKRGLPDMLIVHNRRVFGVELKRRGGSLSKTRIVRTRRGGPRELAGQVDVFERLRAAGMAIAVCEETADVLAALTMWEIPHRRLS